MGTPDYIKRAQNNYNAKFDLVQLKLPKHTKERIKAILDDSMSISGYCVQCVLNTVEAAERVKSQQQELIKTAQGTETSAEKQTTEETAPMQAETENKADKKPMTEEEVMALFKEKKAAVAEWKQQVRESGTQPEEVHQEEFKNLLYGVVDDLKTQKEEREEELPEEFFTRLAQDAQFSEWFENTPPEKAFAELSEKIGRHNAEKVLKAVDEQRMGKL